jgi:hypothetical protein
VTQIDWLARATGNSGGGTGFASAMGNNPAYGDALPAGDWEITPKVYFEGQGTAEMVTRKRFVLAKLESADWTAHVDEPAEAGDLIAYGNDFRFYPDAAAPVLDRPKVDVLAQVIPHVAGISVILQWYDVDDPSDADGPIDDDNALPNDVNNFDNLLSGHTMSFAGSDANGQIRAVWEWTTFHPGNNVRVVVGPYRLAEFDLIKPLKDKEPGRSRPDELDARGRGLRSRASQGAAPR